MFSHVFELTKESPEEVSESRTEIVIHMIANDSDAGRVQYNVQPEVATTVESKIPTYDDLELINTTKRGLSSDLYEVKYNENATETILMGEVTELERMPRDNLDNLEPLEGAYKRYRVFC